MSILVAISSDKSTSWRRHATGINSDVAPFSTEISAIVTALCTGSIEPPTPRPSNLGGAWRLRLLEGDTEVAGGVLADAHADPPSGMEWRNIGM
ncbi:hypothetical protein AWB69_00849 [Caballeronia udeis]|uniref:Uncharacterized protein n=1 Tax=Caballeronia udeis TaxID=1232866 RepID=A0A158F8V4_9BURK|nr:hypothetical protein AWB69_00849 [Caballeronia udeis]